MTFSMDEAREILERTPGVLRALLSGVSGAWAGTDEGPDTFRPIDVLGHLLYGELTDWMPRVQRIHGNHGPRAFDPFDRLGHRDVVAGNSLEDLIARFERAREESLATLDELRIQPEDLCRHGRHPDFGPVTLQQLLAAWVVHDLGHIRQICRVMAGRYVEDVGPWRAYLPVLDEGPSSN